MKRNKRTNQQLDAELYSTSILEDLIETNEFYKVDDILKLSFKAVSDILQTHAQSFRDIKALLTTRASKSQLNTGLSLKTNISDVSKTVQQLSKAIEERPSYQEITSMLRDFASRADLIQLLAEQCSKNQKRANEDQKQSLQVSILKARMDDFQKQISKRVGACVTLPQFQEILTILENKANINQINEALQNKVSKQYLTTALQKKVSKNDLEVCLSKKADTADLDYLINSLEGKVSVSTLEKLTQVLQNKADKSELLLLNNERSNHNRSQQRVYQQEWNDRFEQLKSGLANEIKQCKKQISLQIRQSETTLAEFTKQWQNQLKKSYINLDNEINKKLSKIKVDYQQQIESLRQLHKYIQEDLNTHKKNMIGITNQITVRKRGEENMYNQIDDVRKKLEENICKMVDKKQFIDFKSEVTQSLSNRVEIEVMQTALEDIANETNSKISQDKKDTQQLVRSIAKKFENRLEQNSGNNLTQIIQIKKIINKKQDRNDTSAFEDILKRIRKEVEDCRKTVDISYTEIHSKISLKQYQKDLVEIRKRFQFLKKQVDAKANIKDVCVLADSKPNIDDINKTLQEINLALQDKVTEADLQSFLKDQSTINETLCSENIVGRWMWQSGQVKPGGLIPWETESANTVPEHFFWEKDKTSILIIQAGIYQIIACAFGKSSTVAIVANGQYLGSKQNEENVNNGNKRIRRKKQKQIGGVSVREYAMLPVRSRISASISGDATEGFLNIRRL